MDLDSDSQPVQNQRTPSPEGTLPTGNEAHRPSRRPRLDQKPRWHNQAYMLFLALRQSLNHCLSRTELIKAALALDEKISKERGLPKVFRGKTPMNSASASLTNNTDRYFIPFRPEGSRSMHFKLAYEPGNFDRAVQEYRKWEKKLAEHDWPYCFGVPKNPTLPQEGAMPDMESTEVLKPGTSEDLPKTNTQLHCLTSIPTAPVAPTADRLPLLPANELHQEQHMDARSPQPVDQQQQPPAPEVKLDDLDLSDVPKKWMDIVRVDESSIPGAGKGLFAVRKLPFNTPIGFYFGVPMTEDEYDSLKDGVGRASEYSIMYRRTVLDATDDAGQPFTDPEGPVYCPFHFMNETSEKQANILFIEGAVVNQVILWTKRDIQPGEELLVWYGRDVDRYWESSDTNKNK
ncbi:hypothetical protein BX666DRAFT_1849918 [Dichotomocladium elegans]|nr:hypothetical protein BX666DRAFT_1849918 [Dichotomocladium elegans]